jgi:hypothetical protein
MTLNILRHRVQRLDPFSKRKMKHWTQLKIQNDSSSARLASKAFNTRHIILN